MVLLWSDTKIGMEKLVEIEAASIGEDLGK